MQIIYIDRCTFLTLNIIPYTYIYICNACHIHTYNYIYDENIKR